MALGGGRFTVQNKILPGTYINYTSSVIASTMLSERGVASFCMYLDWGVEGEIKKVTKEEFKKNSVSLFGYEYEAEQLAPLRSYFELSKTALIYRFRGNEKEKDSKNKFAKNTYATAIYPGKCGNNIAIEIIKEDTKSPQYVVNTYYQDKKIDSQTVSKSTELKPNKFVTFQSSATLSDSVDKTNLENGATASDSTIEEHREFLKQCESYSFNILGCISNNKDVKSLYVENTKKMRNDGHNFQTVILWDNKSGNNPDEFPNQEGVIAAHYKTKDSSKILLPLYTVIGDCAGVSLSRNLTNYPYSGSVEVLMDYTQSELEEQIQRGLFGFNKVGDDIHYLKDINSLTDFSGNLKEKFRNNKTVRVVDTVSTYIANLFSTKFIGKIPNTDDNRSILKLFILQYLEELQEEGVLEEITPNSITVKKGEEEDAVEVELQIKITGVMEKLYLQIYVE